MQRRRPLSICYFPKNVGLFNFALCFLFSNVFLVLRALRVQEGQRELWGIFRGFSTLSLFVFGIFRFKGNNNPLYMTFR